MSVGRKTRNMEELVKGPRFYFAYLCLIPPNVLVSGLFRVNSHRLVNLILIELRAKALGLGNCGRLISEVS